MSSRSPSRVLVALALTLPFLQAVAHAGRFKADGKIAEWANVPPSAANLVKGPMPHDALRAAYVVAEEGQLHVRLDAGTAERYAVFVDADDNAATGCRVAMNESVHLDGIEARVLASIDPVKSSKTPRSSSSKTKGRTVSLTFERCDGKTSELLAVNRGTAVAKAISTDSGQLLGVELSIPFKALVGSADAAQLRLAFSAEGPGGRVSTLRSTDGGAAGKPVLYGIRGQGPSFSLSATLTDTVVGNPGGQANPGDTIHYDAVITNTGTGQLVGVTFSDTPDPNTTLVPGSIHSTPLAYPDQIFTDEDTPVVVTLTGDDADGDALTFSIVGTPTNGSVGGITPVNADSAQVTYTPNGEFSGQDSIAFRVTDDDSSTNDDAITVFVNSVNDAPVVNLDADDSGGNSPDFVAGFTEGGGPVLIGDIDATVTDVDTANLASATITLTNILDGASESLSATTTGTAITALYTAGTGVLALTGSDTVANYQTVLRTVAYDNTSQVPNDTARTISVVANDGVDNSTTVNSTIQFTATNDAPVLTAGGAQPSFTENGGAVALDPAITVSDADSPNLLSATVTITNLLDGAAEVLAATTAGTAITANYAAGVLSLSGTDSQANYQQVLQSVTYDNTSEDPTTTARSITFVASDGTLDSNTVTKTLTVNAVNDAPVLSPGTFTATFTEDGGPVAVAATITASDADDANLVSATITITNPQDAAAEVLAASNCAGLTVTPGANSLSITGSQPVATYQTCLQSVTYENTSQSPTGTPDRSVTLVVNDGTADSNTATSTVTVTPVNDAPVVNAATFSINENTATGTNVGTPITFTDPDTGQTHTFAITAGNIGGAFAIDSGTGQITVQSAAELDFEATPSYSLTVQVTDNGTPPESGTATVTVNINNVNEAPTDIALSATTVAENQASGTAVGNFSTTDPDAGDTFTYTLVAGTGSTDNASFQIVGNQLQTNAVFNFEAQSSFSIRVRSTDAGGLFFEEAFTITVTNVNETPTDIALSAATVAENQASGTAVGNFSTTDPDAGDTFTYTLVAGTGSTDNASFQIVGNQLQTAASFNFETQPSLSIRVRSTDAGGLFFEEAFTVTVTNVNETPTDIGLSNATIAENQASGTAVGNFSTTDPDAGDTFTYTLVAGTGSTNNASFQIVGNQLQTAAVLDFETTPSLSIRVRSTDAGGLFFEEAFTITVTNVNEAPTDIALSNASVAENQAINTVVGTFSTTDPDAGDTFTYTLVAGTGSADNASFNINGNQLRTSAIFDFEVKSTYSIRVRSTDAGGLFFEEAFTISVTNVNEAPTDIALSNASIAENQPSGAAVGNFSTTDPDAGDTFTYTLVAGTGSTNNSSFQIVGNQLQTAASFDFETTSSLSIRVRSTDSGGLFFEEAFTITVTNVNEAPTDIALSNASVNENEPANTVVGTFSTTDPDAGDTFTYTLVAGTGSTDNASFNINGNQLRTSAIFNFEVKNSYSIRVRTTDAGGLFFEEAFTITIVNVPEAPIAAADTFDTIGNTELRVDRPAGATPNVPFATAAPPANLGVLDNDTDEDTGQTNSLIVNGITSPACGDATAPFVCATANGGTVTMESDGSFSYLPPAGNITNDSFTYRTRDTDNLTATAAVTLRLFQRVWYVKNDAATGGLGRSSDPFDTLVEAQTASLANDWIFVYFGSGTTTGQAEGIALKNGQHLLGEFAGLSVTVPGPGTFNGTPLPTTVTLVAQPGGTDCGGNPCRPMLDDTVAAVPLGVDAIDAIPAEIVGLNLAGVANAINWTTAAAFAGTGSLSIRDNVVRSAGTSGVNMSLTGTGAINLAFHDNTLTATGTALAASETGTGSLTITAFHDNVVTAASAGAGLSVNTALFDATPGGAVQSVPGGTTLIGTSGDRIGGSGLMLSNVTGILNFANAASGTIGAGDLDIFTDSGTALSVSGGTGGFVFDVTPNAGILVSNSGAAAVISGADIDLQLNSLTSATAGSGVSLTNVSGQFTGPSGSSITKASGGGTAFSIDNSAAGTTVLTSSYAGTINNSSSTGRSVSINNADSGSSATFTGQVTDSPGQGVTLTANTGATISFSGGLTLSTGANTGFNATGGGTVNVSDPVGVANNTIASTTGTALNVVSTTIGSSGLTFQSISAGTAATGPANGIVLNSTGSTAGLTVTGDGSTTGGLLDRDGSGGTIQNTTGDAIVLTSAFNVTLRQMNITNAGWDGVQSTGGGGIVLSALDINTPGQDNPASNGSTGNPSGFGGGNGWYAENITGANVFDNNSRVFNWQSSQSNGIVVNNNNTDFTSFTVDNTLFSTSATGAAGFHGNMNGTSGGHFIATDSEFTLIDQNAYFVTNNGSDAVRVTVQGNNFHDSDNTSGDGNNTLFLALAGSGDMNFTIGGATPALGNTFTNTARLQTLAGIVQVNAAGGTASAGAQLNGTIQNNTITNPAFVSGRRGIMVAAEASAGSHGGHTVLIANNSVQNLNIQGIYASLTSVSGAFDLLDNHFTIRDNQVGNIGAVGQGGGDGGSAIEFETNIAVDGSNADISANILIQANTAVSNNNSGIGDTLEVANRSGNNTGAGNTSLLNLTILGNNLTQQNAGGDVFQISNSIMTTTTVNVDLNSANNAADRNTFTGGDADGVLLRNDAGTFRIENLMGAAKAFVELRNNGIFTVTGTIVTTGAVPMPNNPAF